MERRTSPRARVGRDRFGRSPRRPSASPNARRPWIDDPADRVGHSRVERHLSVAGLEAEHRPDEEERRAGRPGLRAAGRRVGDGEAAERPRVARERLRQPVRRERRRVEHRQRDPVRLVAEAVAGQAVGDDRVVVRPDRAAVVADRVEPLVVGRQRPDAPAREQRGRPSAGEPRSPRAPRTRSRSRGAARCSRSASRSGACRRRARWRSSRRGRRSRSRARSARAGRSPRPGGGSPAPGRRAARRPARPAGSWRRRRSPGSRPWRSAGTGSDPSANRTPSYESRQHWLPSPCDERVPYST